MKHSAVKGKAGDAGDCLILCSFTAFQLIYKICGKIIVIVPGRVDLLPKLGIGIAGCPFYSNICRNGISILDLFPEITVICLLLHFSHQLTLGILIDLCSHKSACEEDNCRRSQNYIQSTFFHGILFWRDNQRIQVNILFGCFSH